MIDDLGRCGHDDRRFCSLGVARMRPVFHRSVRVLVGVVATVAAAFAASGQDGARRAPSEANHFIETPTGWVHPRTPWGDPDLQGMWPISYVGDVPLQRCFGFGGRTGAPCGP